MPNLLTLKWFEAKFVKSEVVNVNNNIFKVVLSWQGTNTLRITDKCISRVLEQCSRIYICKPLGYNTHISIFR